MGVSYIPDRDQDGRQIMRPAAASSGWSYIAHSIELTTATKDSWFSEDHIGNSANDIELKFFNSSGTELTTQLAIDTSCTHTQLLWKPSYDYEMIAGQIYQTSLVNSNLRAWVSAGMLEDESYVVEFVRGVNFKFIGTDERLETDGRVSKFMKHTTEGLAYQTNQFRFDFKHNILVKHDLMIILEYFRA